jgi:hypothetical protein
MGNPLRYCPGCSGFVVLIMENDPERPIYLRLLDFSLLCRHCNAVKWGCS